MANQFISTMKPTVGKLGSQLHLFRWGTTALVAILAVLDLWPWAWLALGVAVFAVLTDTAVSLVTNLVAIMSAQLPVEDTRGSSRRAA